MGLSAPTGTRGLREDFRFRRERRISETGSCTMGLCRILMNVALLAGIGSVACAGQVSGLVTFSAGTTAKAAEVNGNFTAVKSAVDDNHARIQALEQAVAALQSTVATLSAQLSTVQGSSVMKLEDYLTVDDDDYGRPRARLSGINLQIVNGEGGTSTANGLGNLIVGYDEPREMGGPVCSIGQHIDETSCVANNGTWALSHKSGSHYVIVGMGNSYSQYGGLLAGVANVGNGEFASVTGGTLNTASGRLASVTGGQENTAYGQLASVTGGQDNIARGEFASVAGGQGNAASGAYANVSGGWNNHATGPYASVTGGLANEASGQVASVSGGSWSVASGSGSSVTGGLNNTASHVGSTVGGGHNVSTSTDLEWIAGP